MSIFKYFGKIECPRSRQLSRVKGYLLPDCSVGEEETGSEVGLLTARL